ncbi:2-oxoacid:acceptor oxidoreductase family protein [Candidatus Aenigmatarchaeota archaeon]
MAIFEIYGNKNQPVKRVTKAIGRACFLSGFRVLDYVENKGEFLVGVVKTTKDDMLSIGRDSADFLITLDSEFLKKIPKSKIKQGSTVLLNSKIKIAMKKYKTKNFIIDADEISEDEKKFSSAISGAVTKLDGCISVKNMKKALDIEFSSIDGFDEGYKSVKQLR